MMKKILVVDDERDICRLLKDELSMEGYVVYTAESGTEALQKLSETPDLILLDINMPDMDGYGVCEKIRDYISCPILFLTARTDESDCIPMESGWQTHIPMRCLNRIWREYVRLWEKVPPMRRAVMKILRSYK